MPQPRTLILIAALVLIVTARDNAIAQGRGILIHGDGRKSRLDIFSMNVDGSDVVQITRSTQKESSPVWSPDETLIAHSHSPWSTPDIFVINSDGSNQFNLTQTRQRQESRPVWSPDGKKIAYSATVRDSDETHVIVMDIATGIESQITGGSVRHLDPDWSPDGKWIAYVQYSHAQPLGIVSTELNTGNTKLLVPAPGPKIYLRFPAWSPDGRKIAYNFERNPGSTIQIVDIESGSIDLSIELEYSAGASRWSPDQTRLLFAATGGSASLLGILDLKTREITTILEPSFEYSDGEPSWSKDGNRILFRRGYALSKRNWAGLAATMYESGSYNLHMRNDEIPHFSFATRNKEFTFTYEEITKERFLELYHSQRIH